MDTKTYLTDFTSSQLAVFQCKFHVDNR